MLIDPVQVLQAGSRVAPALPARTVLVAGATGVLGNEVVRQLTGAGVFARTVVLAQEAMRAGMRGVEFQLVEGTPMDDWPTAAAETAVVMFEPPRLFHDRERALWTPKPSDLPKLAAWLRACGVSTLAVVLPHAQGRLPEALKRGLASLDEQAVAAVGFERLIIIRSPQKPDQDAGASFPVRVARFMLSAFQYMVPSSEQPVRAVKLAQLLAVALQIAPEGIHVAAPEVVWRASQGDLRRTAEDWLAR